MHVLSFFSIRINQDAFIRFIGSTFFFMEYQSIMARWR